MYNETEAKDAYLQRLDDLAATQDLSEDVRNRVRWLSVAFTIVAAVFVILRFVGRWRQVVRFGVDDWLIVAAWVFLLGNMVFNLVLIDQGLGLHAGVLTLAQQQKLNQTIVGAEIIYVTGVNMYKISLLFLYFRIFPVRSIRIGGYFCGAISTAWNFACVFAAAFQCTPRAKIWEPWVQGTCINIFLTQLCVSIPSILCDVVILFLPLPHVWRLKTNTTQRVFLLIIFSLGSYVVFTSIYRFTIYLSYNTIDIPYTLAEPCAWNIIEISSGISCSCLPTLGALVKTVFKSLYPSTRSKPTQPTGGYNRSGTNLKTIGGGDHPDASARKWTRIDSETESGGGHKIKALHRYSNPTVVTVTHGRDESWHGSSSDDIPLTGIRRQKDITWTEERVTTPEPPSESKKEEV